MKIEIHVHLADLPELLAIGSRILQKLETLEIKMSQMDDDIAALQASVTAENTVIDSAITLISGFSAQLTAAVNAALAAGATEAQLQAVTDLKTAVDTKQAALASAVSAGTPAASTP